MIWRAKLGDHPNVPGKKWKIFLSSTGAIIPAKIILRTIDTQGTFTEKEKLNPVGVLYMANTSIVKK